MASRQAQQFLDRLHENVWQGMNRTPRPRSAADDTEVQSMIDQLLSLRSGLIGRKKTEELRAGLQRNERLLRATTVSKYEDARTIQGLHRLADTMERAARIAGFPVPERPLLGTLPTGRVNVVTLVVPGTGEHLVLFESEFSGFAYLASKAVAELLPYRRTPDGGAAIELEPAKVRERLVRHPESARRFGELVTAYLETGVPYNAPQYLQEPVRNTWAGVLCEAVQLFALGHEYGHILRGHLGQQRPAAWLGGPELAEPEEVAWSNQEEVEADGEGLSLSIAAMQSMGYDLPVGFLGADFFFTMTHVLERAINVLRHGRENVSTGANATHPPSVLRRMVLRHVLSRHNTPEVESAIMLAGNLENAVELLWRDLRPHLLEAHRAGMRPLRQWRD
ncbi:hypothetical protein [Streptomyces sp. enrichment culture]|uniref:hypothetical protein n=1 Tax=Streptomyces sp. enrichment culture TaxID=1795815 RepID=UPI003F5480F7